MKRLCPSCGKPMEHKANNNTWNCINENCTVFSATFERGSHIPLLIKYASQPIREYRQRVGLHA